MNVKINLYGNSFLHNKVDGLISSTENKKPEQACFVLDGSGKINLFVDKGILEVNKVKNNYPNYAWLLESKTIQPDLIKYFLNDTQNKIEPFVKIFTHNQKLLNLNNKFVFLYPTHYWVDENKLTEKSKLVSMIASTKKATKMQKTRNKYAKKMENKIDVFGEGRNLIQKKEEGLSEYYFSIVIENDLTNNYFSEKILDCFAMKTIPIYLGSRNIKNYFDINGIIWFDQFKLNKLTEELYFSKIESVERNYRLVKNFKMPEDVIVDHLI